MFVAAGHDVVIVDNLSSGTLDNKNEKDGFTMKTFAKPGLEQSCATSVPIIDTRRPRLSFRVGRETHSLMQR